METIEKIKIGINQNQLDYDTKLYFENKEILYQATNEYQKLMGEQPNLKTFIKGFIACAVSVINERHPEALALGLSQQKLFDLFGYNTQKLEALEGQYNTALQTEPKESDYYIYAENEQEIKRYNQALQLCEAWNTLNENTPQIMARNKYIHYTNAMSNLPLIPSIEFIKNGF